MLFFLGKKKIFCLISSARGCLVLQSNSEWMMGWRWQGLDAPQPPALSTKPGVCLKGSLA